MPLEKSDIDFVCNSVRFTGKYTDHGQTWSDLQIMTLAKARTMDKGGRAEQFLNHYLAGSGEPIHFSLRTLMEEDPGVRARIFGAINAARAPLKNSKGKIQGLRQSCPRHLTLPLPASWIFRKPIFEITIGSLRRAH